MAQPWFRFYSEALRDRKLEYICRMTGQPKVIIVGFWVTLLALGNDSPDRGALLIAENLAVTLADLVRDTELPEQDITIMLEAFERLEMIARPDGVILLCNWDKRQFASDNSTGRVQAHRAKLAAERAREAAETLQQRCEQQDGNTPDTEQSITEQNRAEGQSKTGDGAPVLASPPTLPSGIPDPSSMTVAKIKELKLDKRQWQVLGDAEAKGKNRAGVHDFVERRTHAAPPAVEAFRKLTNAYPSKAVWPSIASAVGDAPESIDFWRRVVTGYIALGWNARNIANMLEFFNRREIPSARGAANGQRSSGRASAPSRITPKPPVTDANTPTPEQLASDRRALDEHFRRQREAAAAGTG